MDLTIGSFDDPSRFAPKHHFGAESVHEAWLDTRDLPRYRTDEHKPLVDRWMKTVGKLPALDAVLRELRRHAAGVEIGRASGRERRGRVGWELGWAGTSKK